MTGAAVTGGVATGTDGDHGLSALFDDGRSQRRTLRASTAEDDTFVERDRRRYRKGAGRELDDLAFGTRIDGALDVRARLERRAHGSPLRQAVRSKRQMELLITQNAWVPGGDLVGRDQIRRRRHHAAGAAVAAAAG